MNMGRPKNPILDTSAINKYDDESMRKRMSSLFLENKNAIDDALNFEGLSYEQFERIILRAKESDRKEIVVLMNNVRMIVEVKEKSAACKAFAKYINSIE